MPSLNSNFVVIPIKTLHVFRCAPDLADRAKENPKSVTEAEWRQLLSSVQYQVDILNGLVDETVFLENRKKRRGEHLK